MPSGPQQKPDAPYHADIEFLTGCLRIFAPGDVPDRDPYKVSGTIVAHDRETIEIKGIVFGEEDHVMLMRNAIAKAAIALGFTTVLVRRRRRDGSTKVVRFPLARYQPTE